MAYIDIERLNKDIEKFPQVKPITNDMVNSFEGVAKLVLLDRYSFKDTEKITIKIGDFVVLTVKPDSQFPARGYGIIRKIEKGFAEVEIDEQFQAIAGKKVMNVPVSQVDKPLELFYEQVADRVARGLSDVEITDELKSHWREKFREEIESKRFVPAGRVLYGAGTDSDVTLYNCYVQPMPKDSRDGIAEHRAEVMNIMSRGGGVGTNGSTLRPRNALARGVNGKSSGSVSWLNDIAQLTHLVEQGGSRRGAQMILLNDWHPDILEFIISKMQNPRILRFIIETSDDETVRELAKNKLKFTPFTPDELTDLKSAHDFYIETNEKENERRVKALIDEGGRYSVHNPEFLSGANISVGITQDFMDAVESDEMYDLRFPDVDNYTDEQMAEYNASWQEVGDVREWHLPVKTYRSIKAKELWNMINICATYSAEPGIFFIDNANEKTNAKAYGQKVVATNPCGEQPLAPYSVCNLAAVNLAEMVDKETKEVDFEMLRNTVSIGVRMQDNVIDATPYFLEKNTKQALGERRVGLGVMGLADMLIYAETRYGSEEGNRLVNKVFKEIATTAYRTSIDLAKEKGSFPFLNPSYDYFSDTNDFFRRKLRENFANTGYMKHMPSDIRLAVRENGIRNSHLLTVAPTGSTGTLMGVGTGLEPYFAFKYFRSGRLGKYMEVNASIVEEYLADNPEADPDNLPEWFVSSMELTPEDHADVQCIIQRWVDSSLSKTVNAPKGYSVEQVANVYERLYNGGAKGGTIYVDGSRDAQVLSLSKETEDSPKEKEETKMYEPNTVVDLKATNVKTGTNIGDTCPVCREGTVIDAGGCATCDSCGSQLKCEV